MFDKPYRLRGIHAKKARELVATFDGDSKTLSQRKCTDYGSFLRSGNHAYREG